MSDNLSGISSTPLLEDMASPERGAAAKLTIYTIGFTQKTAERFFSLLRDARIENLVDTRIFPNTQLSGFAKGVDLPFFLSNLIGAHYEHRVDLAPTESLLRDYRNRVLQWQDYEAQYKSLLSERRVEDHLSPTFFTRRTALLCSEASSKHCHRRLLVEYLSSSWGPIERIDL